MYFRVVFIGNFFDENSLVQTLQTDISKLRSSDLDSSRYLLLKYAYEDSIKIGKDINASIYIKIFNEMHIAMISFLMYVFNCG